MGDEFLKANSNPHPCHDHSIENRQRRAACRSLILCSSVNLQAKSKLDGTYKGIWTNTQDSFFSGPATIKIKSIGKGNAVNVQISGAVQFVEFNTPVSNPFKASLHATNASGKEKPKSRIP